MKATSSTQALEGLPARLREARRASGKRIERIAVDIDRSCQTIHGYESGNVNPPLPVLAALADSYGTSVSQLLGEEVTA